MLVLPFFMDAGNICISGWQHSFTSLHFMHLWFNFWCFFRPTQMLHPNLVYFGHLSWVHSLHFEVEKSLPIPIPWNVYLKLPIFSIQFFYQLSFISHFILKLLFFKKNPNRLLSISFIPLQAKILFSFCLKPPDIFPVNHSSYHP